MASSSSSPLLARVAHETGVSVLSRSSRDVKLLFAQRLVRMFAYGLIYPVLVQFLSSLSIPEDRVGLFMTLTLLGDTVLSFVLTAITDRVGRRRVLAAGALAMCAGGATFAFASSYWLLLLASVFGVISPAGKEIGPFRAVEESILAQLTKEGSRSDVFAWYTLMGTAGMAVGTLWCGWMVQILQDSGGSLAPWAYRSVFVLYAIVGVGKLLMVLCLSSEVELEVPPSENVESDAQGLLSEHQEDQGQETPPLGHTAAPQRPVGPVARSVDAARGLVPHITPESRTILYRLLLLFSLDSFSSGMASPSWLTYFFTSVHSLEPGALGTLFLVSNILASLSNLVALPIARRVGPLKTMVFTHLPSAIFLAMIPWPPATRGGTWLAMALLAARSSTSSMDQAPRQAFLSAAVLPQERTAVLGVVNVIKTLAQAGGTGVAGVLADAKNWTINFTGAGAMKAGYDLLMLGMFLGIQSRGAQMR